MTLTGIPSLDSLIMKVMEVETFLFRNLVPFNYIIEGNQKNRSESVRRTSTKVTE